MYKNEIWRQSLLCSRASRIIWNSIPAAVREADTVSSFKRKLKTHFFLCALTMLDFEFCNALPVRARVGSGTITAIYYYYYYYYFILVFDQAIQINSACG